MAAAGDAAHKPARKIADPKELLLGYLDYFRSVIARKIEGLAESDLRTSRVPSGWTPLELAKHLAYMEERWLCWGFMAEQIRAPYGDEDEAGRWYVAPEETVAELMGALHAVGERTRRIVSEAELSDIAAAGGRFSEADPGRRPTLGWILMYVLQEYARHAGHLDIARELIDHATGE